MGGVIVIQVAYFCGCVMGFGCVLKVLDEIRCVGSFKGDGV